MKKLFCEDEKIAYYAGDDGKIFSFKKKSGEWRELKTRKNHNGYRRFDCYQNGKGKTTFVHHAVYEAFNGPIPQGLEINHINCKRDDNSLSNLEVVTSLQNHIHAPTREHMREAKRHKMKPVLDVTTGVVYESANEAARQTGLKPGNISACCHGKRPHTGGHTFTFATPVQ